MVTINIEKQMTDNKKDIRTRQLIVHEVAEIIEAYSEYTVAQHLSYILDKINSYYFDNERFLKEVQKYRSKLEDDIIEGEEEYFETELQ